MSVSVKPHKNARPSLFLLTGKKASLASFGVFKEHCFVVVFSTVVAVEIVVAVFTISVGCIEISCTKKTVFW